eukprot:TRINITY_DN6457_c0_g1_i1.p1 TRINITY_DN6457_c0_g1~~TRINITY_DN6457_c0_g1_i1.p1  ORF type:complete len:537 (-),score=141.24 TRINITY_DN6457_c0_g1_i1:77-1687(-)
MDSPTLKLKLKLPNKEEMADNPLKIVIKKADLASSTPSGSQSEKVTLSLVEFPTITAPHFKKFAALSSYEQIEKMGEKDLTGLESELEAMQRSFKDTLATLQSQLEALENWRVQDRPSDLRDSTNGTSTPIKEEPIPLPQETATPAVVQQRQRHQTKGGKTVHSTSQASAESSSEEDPSYSGRGRDDDSSEEEDDLDAEDFEDGGSVLLPDSKKRKDPTSRRGQNKPGGGNPLMRKNNRKERMGAGRGTRERGRGTRVRGRNQKGGRPSRAGSDFSDPEDLLPAPTKHRGKNNFWLDMEPYFSPFTSDDVRFCHPQGIEEDDSAFIIPPLGKSHHRSDEWEDDYETDFLRPHRYRDDPMEAAHPVVTDLSERSIACGDLTQRILAALIEEAIIPASIHGRLHSDADVGDVFTSHAGLEEDTLPLWTPPTFDYSHAAMLSLEERIKMELCSIGLLDDEDLDSREDDEICSELRKLQRELKEQIVSNNTIRAKVAGLLVPLMAQEDEQKKQRISNIQLERNYMKSQKKKRVPTRKVAE